MRNYFFLFLLIISTTNITAQARLAKSEMYFGASLGVTAASVGFKPTVDLGYLNGLNGGVAFRYIAEKNVGFQAELNFSQRGWKETSGLYSRRLNYIELPFMTHIYIGKKSRFFINLGPKIAYLISENAIKNNTVSSTETQHTTLIQNPFDYGICAGLGYMVNIKGQVFQIEGRGYYGLSDIYSNLKRDYFDASDNQTLSVSFGWMIKTK